MQKTLSVREVNRRIATTDYVGAKQQLEAAIAASGDFFLYHELLGDVLTTEGQTSGAQACFARALELNPKAIWIRDKLHDKGAIQSGVPQIGTEQTAGTSVGSGAGATFVGLHHRYPDLTGKRQAEGGARMKGLVRGNLPGQPLVTIVTAVYDNSATFQRCIDSVLAQTYPNIEYIIVDGGSPKAILDIVRKNEARVDYYISEPDSGIYAAMNKGISLARGDYVCLLNSDDFHDPDFVRRSVETALASDESVDIVYSDFYDGDTRLPAQPLNPGILLGNLNVSHCTFLVRKDCYEDIGPYDTDLKIVSDMVWLRKAFTSGKRYKLLSEAYFHFSHGGASSGNSPERRQMIISENGHCYRQDFPFLTQEEAETLYLLRFSSDRLSAVSELVRQHPDKSVFLDALARYLEHCFRDRGAFKLAHTDVDRKLPLFLEVADLLGVDAKLIRLNTREGCLSEILGRISTLSTKSAVPGAKRVLHYVTVFSAPSETFIYDLVTRLESDTAHENFVLYQHSQLRSERPYAKGIEMPWPNFRPEVAQLIYKYIVKTLKIDLIIAHFAINEHRLHMRVANTGTTVPTIVMTHGIDVFALKKPSDYTRHVMETLSQRHDVAFTAVSDYLRGELVSAGVAADKITVIPNTVNDSFLRHRKSTGFYDGTRPLRLLCIGRLIALKGHRFLIDALDRFRRRRTADFHLTIVYGNGRDELENLQNQVAALKLEGHITFEPFVDFKSDPGYLSRFDIYIHASTYENDAGRRSESFGVAVLEAIAAGLPVISTDAGGLPEVLGQNGTHARIVKHGDADAICTALLELHAAPSTFTDNRAYAEDRLTAFSASAQIAALSQLMDRVTARPLKAAVFSSATTQGAGYAAYRVHMGLLKTTVRPTIFTTVRSHEKEPGVRFVGHPSGDGTRWRSMQLPLKAEHTIFTINQTSIRSEDLVKMVADYDVIALHWHARFLSIENIASLTHLGKPVVMTIRDMYPLTGGCHFFHGCEKWQTDCTACPQIQTAYTDYPAQILRAKQQNYNFDNLTLVTISNHTRNIVQRSPVFSRCRLETIPNSIETDVFRPHDKATARRELGLPLDRHIIGYVPSFSSEVKGYREILEVFQRLKGTLPGGDPFVMLVGNETPATKQIAFEKKSLGYISDNTRLAQIYSAADVVVVPSLEETFSNTTAEAVSCGVPVVGFKTGAIPDLAVDGKTGYTYEVGDVAGMTDGIRRVLTGPDMGAACRAHAEAMLSFMTQARRYEALFSDLVARAPQRDPSQPTRIFNAFEEPSFGQISIAAESLSQRK